MQVKGDGGKQRVTVPLVMGVSDYSETANVPGTLGERENTNADVFGNKK